MKIRFEMTAKEFALISATSSKVKGRFNSVKKTLSVLLFGPKEESKTNLVSKVSHNKSIQSMANISEEGAILEIHVAENYVVKANELFCRYMETYISAAEAIVPLIGVYANRLKGVITEAAELESQNNVEIYQLAPNVFMSLEVLRELNIAYDTTFNEEEGKGRIIFKHLGVNYGISVDARDFDSNRELYNSDTDVHILGIDSSKDLVSDIETLRDYDIIWTSVRN